jgi:uncharacterized protein (DUF2236 family)
MAGLDNHPNDDGLFGPQSVSWRAFASPASAIGVATAVLMQMIHPRVVRMIDQASNVRNDPAGRAAGTSQYGITIIDGDTETASAPARYCAPFTVTRARSIRSVARPTRRTSPTC